jgi:hypothetical protein
MLQAPLHYWLTSLEQTYLDRALINVVVRPRGEVDNIKGIANLHL